MVLSRIVTLGNAIHTMDVKNTFTFECDKENNPSLAITASEANNTCRANGVSDIPYIKTIVVNATSFTLLSDCCIRLLYKSGLTLYDFELTTTCDGPPRRHRRHDVV